jgi:ATP-dependent DNA ligase
LSGPQEKLHIVLDRSQRTAVNRDLAVRAALGAKRTRGLIRPRINAPSKIPKALKVICEFELRMVKRAKAAMPGFMKPQLATLKMKAPSEGWVHEIKYDGYRAQVHVDKGTARIFTRNGHD